MSIYQELDYNHDIQKITGVQFSILSPEEIRKRSVAEIFTQETYENDKPKIGGLFDPRMGVLDHGNICPTDKLNNRESPGYFGHIELALPVFHMHFMKYIINTMKCVCWKCSKLLIDVNDPRMNAIKHKKNNNRHISVLDLCSKITHCGDCNIDGCGAKKPDSIKKDNQGIGKIQLNFNIDNKKTQLLYDASDVLKILKRISDEECEMMGFSRKFCRPDWLICSVFGVPPPSVRPSVRSDSNTRMEDDLTHKLCDIVKTNRTLKCKLNGEGIQQRVIDEWYQLLTYHISTFVDNQIKGIPPAQQRSGRPLKSIKERLKSKEGRIRGNLMGKRVDYSARSVITPDPNLSINELGVPIDIATNITFPEKVTKFNIKKLQKVVENGYFQHPGAKSIKRNSDKKIISLKIITDYKLEIGDIVNRHINDGDVVLFNRQPSLHKMSMMGHYVKVLPFKTFRLNVSVTTPYNADFDGDEMNMHVPQSIQTANELKTLALVETQIITPAQHKPIIGLVQDSIIGSYLLTQYNNYLTKSEVLHILTATSIKILPKPDIKKNTEVVDDEKKFPKWFPKYKYIRDNRVVCDLWSGRTVFSCILPDINFVKENDSFSNDSTKYWDPKLKREIQMNKVVIKSGIIEQGVLDKSILGTKDSGLIHIVHNQYGYKYTRLLLDNIQNLLTAWMLISGFSIGLGDLIADEESKTKMTNVIIKNNENVNDIIKHVHNSILENKTGKSNSEEFEQQVLQNINNSSNESGKIASQYLDNDNRLKSIVNSGSKGSGLNIGQMIACVGQQSIDGKRIPYGYTDRSLPHFTKYDDGPMARGFVKNSFVKGLTPTEFYYHAQGGREGLIDTAVKTSETGYIQRKLVKGMEDLHVKHDYTIRNSNDVIVQFLYGEDGIDPIKIEKQNIFTITMTNEEIERDFRINIKHLKKYILPEVYETFLTKYDKNMQKLFNEYYQSILNEKKIFIEDISLNKIKNGGRVFAPVNIKRIIENSQKINGIKNKTNLTPDIIIDKLKELEFKLNINNELFKENKLFISLLKCYLSPNHLIKKKISTENLDFIITTILEQYLNSFTQPGENVGIISAQSIGEPSTQMTLNTFHFAGVSSKSQVTRGLPRFKELLSTTKNIKSAYNTIFLKPEFAFNKEKASQVLNQLPIIKINQVVTKSEIYFNKDNQQYQQLKEIYDSFYSEIKTSISHDWTLQITFDKHKMLDKGISMRDIYFQVINKFNQDSQDDIFCMCSDDNSSELILIIQLNELLETEKQKDIISILKVIEESIMNDIILSGVDNIENASMYMEDIHTLNTNADYEKKTEWVIDTTGSNLLEVFKHPAVDYTRTISNDIHEILEILGIEATRNLLIHEITEIFEQSSSYVNYRHISLLVDIITNKGTLMSIDRHGINKSDRGPFAKCSFEETPDIIAKSAIFGEIDNMNGVSANIMLGQEPKCGTGMVELLFDEEKYTELIDTIEEEESEEEENKEFLDNMCIEENIQDDIYDII